MSDAPAQLRHLRDVARRAQDLHAARVLDEALDADGASPDSANEDDHVRELLRGLIDARGRAAATVASQHPEAADRLRREAEVLTVALARLGG